MAVAGVGTQAWPGSWSLSSARHSVVSPSITEVAAYPGSPWASMVPRYRCPAVVRAWISMRKKPVRRVLSPGPMARGGQPQAKQCPGRPERQPCLRGLDARQRPWRPSRARPGAEPGDLLVPEPAAVATQPTRALLRRTTRVLTPAITPGAGPHPQLTVIPGPVQVTLVAEARFGRPVGSGRKGHRPAGPGAGPHLIQLPHHRGQGPAAEPAPHRPDHECGVQQVTSTVGLGSLMQQQHPQVGWNRVEPAAVHDPRTSAGGRVVAAVDAVPDEQHLARQVRVIGARLSASLPANLSPRAR